MPCVGNRIAGRPLRRAAGGRGADRQRDPKNLLAAANYLNLKLTARDVLFGAKQTMPLVFFRLGSTHRRRPRPARRRQGLSINNRIGIELRALSPRATRNSSRRRSSSSSTRPCAPRPKAR
jgi:hypothetical protein